MTFYDAFCGIGGFHLGLSRAGMKCVGACEIDDYARQVYKKRFGIEPDRDIRSVNSIRGADLLCGGFPCQPFSLASKRREKEDERNLWPEMLRLVDLEKPKWVVGENVPAIGQYLDTILEDLQRIGYTTLPLIIPASAFGSPQDRHRLWLVAHSDGDTCLVDAAHNTGNAEEEEERRGEEATEVETGELSSLARRCIEQWRVCKPPIFGMASWIPSQLDEVKCLGNAVVPQVVEWIGKRINQTIGETNHEKTTNTNPTTKG